MPRIVFPPSALPQRPVGSDTAGLEDAQARLREALGVDAVFVIPGTPSWPPGTPMDPETGKPFDPFLEPTVPVVDERVTVRCSFVHHPFAGIDPAASPAGGGDMGDAALIVPLARYPEIRTATRVVIGEDTWDIQRFRYDVSLTVPRWIAYLERA
jgi:hypothetical protein